MEWKDDFTLGVASIDAQHKELIKLLNLLQIAIKKGDTQKAYANTIRALVAYTQHHFSDEETYMHTIGYPRLAEQQKIHAKLIGDTKKILVQLKQGQPIQPISLLRFLNDWVCKHILDEDLKIGRYTLTLQRTQVAETLHPNPLGSDGEVLIAGFQSLAKLREHNALSENDYVLQCLDIINNNFECIDFSSTRGLEQALPFIDYLLNMAIISSDDAVGLKKALVKKALAADVLSAFSDAASQQRFLVNLRNTNLLAVDDFEKYRKTVQTVKASI